MMQYYFNPLPPHGGRPYNVPHYNAAENISIHSLRMEGDRAFSSLSPPINSNFNPLPPHGGRQLVVFVLLSGINPLPPHGGRPPDYQRIQTLQRISIHSLRMEGDPARSSSVGSCVAFQSTPSAWRETGKKYTEYEVSQFQSTPSAWRETQPNLIIFQGSGISIHSLRMEGDTCNFSIIAEPARFQSTPSAWRETASRTDACSAAVFQSTPSAWRETLYD